MRLRTLVLSALTVLALASPVFAQDSTPGLQEQAYRAYLDANRNAEATNRREDQVRLIALLILAGTVAFVAIPIHRNARRALELSEQHQKTLEEIRDLLKKQ